MLQTNIVLDNNSRMKVGIYYSTKKITLPDKVLLIKLKSNRSMIKKRSHNKRIYKNFRHLIIKSNINRNNYLQKFKSTRINRNPNPNTHKLSLSSLYQQYLSKKPPNHLKCRHLNSNQNEFLALSSKGWNKNSSKASNDFTERFLF